MNNRREPAIQAYREILASCPDDVLALSRMAAVLISESRWGDVLDAANRLIKIPTGAVIGHTLAGVAHHNTSDSEFAVFEFDRVLQLDPELKQMPLKPRSMFWLEYGQNLLAVGRSGDARRHLRVRSARVMTRVSRICSVSPTISKGRLTTLSATGGRRFSGTRTASASGGGLASSNLSGAGPWRRSSRSGARLLSSRR